MSLTKERKLRTRRSDRDVRFLWVAQIIATGSTCARRAVGAVIVDAAGHICATGYNGVPAGVIHCIEKNCPGADMPSGQGLDICQAVHGEANALLQLSGRVFTPPLTMYITTTPCMGCAKMILNTAVKRIVASSRYSHADAVDFLKDHNIKVDVLETAPILNFNDHG